MPTLNSKESASTSGRDVEVKISREITRRNFMSTAALGAAVALLDRAAPSRAESWLGSQDALLPIPDRLVVLTFDDGVKTNITHVAPVLKSHGFGASFYVTQGLRKELHVGDDTFLSWDDIRRLHQGGFEIGNHTEHHVDVTKLSKKQLVNELEGIERRCKEHEIPVPTTFVYPSFRDSAEAAQVLLQKGYLFARRGVGPEFQDGGRGARGPAYDPLKHHPLLIPTTGYGGQQWHFQDLAWAVDQARDGKIAVLCFHGVPYPAAPWDTVEPEVFDGYMRYLHEQGCKVIAMQDLVKYVKPAPLTSIPLQREKGDF